MSQHGGVTFSGSNRRALSCKRYTDLSAMLLRVMYLESDWRHSSQLAASASRLTTASLKEQRRPIKRVLPAVWRSVGMVSFVRGWALSQG